MKPLIYIILGSTREGRNGEQVAKWFHEVAKTRSDMDFELVDLRDWQLPFMTSAKPPSSGEYELPLAKEWSAKIAKADGFVFVTPEYNHGYPAVLKNAIDHLYHEWKRKPVAMVSYGGASGGSRAAEQLRQVAAELHMVSVREGLLIPSVWNVFKDGKPAEPGWDKRANVVLDDLAWWAVALKSARK